jgi:hypothetical protein
MMQKILPVLLLMVISKTVLANCDLQITAFHPKERAEKPYTRYTYYVSTESNKDPDAAMVFLYYVAYELNQSLSEQKIKTWKNLVKKAENSTNRDCSSCELSDEEVIDLVEKNSKNLMQLDALSVDLSKIMELTNKFYLGLSHIDHPDKFFYRYSAYHWNCIEKDESGNESKLKIELTQDQINNYLKNNYSREKLYANITEEAEENENVRMEYMETFEGFMKYLIQESSPLSSDTIIFKAVSETLKNENNKFEEWVLKRELDQKNIPEKIAAPANPKVQSTENTEAPQVFIRYSTPDKLPEIELKPIETKSSQLPQVKINDVEKTETPKTNTKLNINNIKKKINEKWRKVEPDLKDIKNKMKKKIQDLKE